jgi:hypothetical protein
LLRGYGDAAFYGWPTLEKVGDIELPDQEQGEGIAVDGAGRVYLSSEGLQSAVLRLKLPQRIQDRLDPLVRRPDRGADDDPGSVIDDDEAAQDVARPFWPWAVGGVIGIGLLVVLLRALRPR